MMAVLLIRGLTLPGALYGIQFYLHPDPARLLDPQVHVYIGSTDISLHHGSFDATECFFSGRIFIAMHFFLNGPIVAIYR